MGDDELVNTGIRIERWLLDRLTAEAKAEGRSMANQLRRILSQRYTESNYGQALAEAQKEPK